MRVRRSIVALAAAAMLGLSAVGRRCAGPVEISRLVRPMGSERARQRAMGSDQAERTRAAAAADGGVSGGLRGELADRATGGLGGDPTAKCIPHGLPRMMIGIYPMELIITPKTTYLLSDYNEPRRIYTDGRSWPQELEPTFNGLFDRLLGRCTDGEGRFGALEVETRGFKGPRTFEGTGIPPARRRADHHQGTFPPRQGRQESAADEVTTIDHALTRPWTVVRPYRREPNPIWFSVDCSEDNHHVWVGEENYFVSEDGYLMPTKKGQRPPDPRYFNARPK